MAEEFVHATGVVEDQRLCWSCQKVYRVTAQNTEGKCPYCSSTSTAPTTLTENPEKPA